MFIVVKWFIFNLEKITIFYMRKVKSFIIKYEDYDNMYINNEEKKEEKSTNLSNAMRSRHRHECSTSPATTNWSCK